METAGAFLETCRLARKQTHRNLTVFSLLGTGVFGPACLLLETALDAGLVEIRVLGPAGSVPGLRPVLVVDGEMAEKAERMNAHSPTMQPRRSSRAVWWLEQQGHGRVLIGSGGL